MSITVQDNTFTSTTTAEAPSTFVAGTVSFSGLIPLFGTTGSNGTSETEIGLMTIPSLTNWFSRLYSRPAGISGPTGPWAPEWWAVHNYLQYGGICVIGATGSTGDYYNQNGTITPTATPLHNKSLVTLDAVFDAGNTASAEAAISVSTTREDCLAVIGNYKRITGVPGLAENYTDRTADFGFDTVSPYVIYVAGRKKFTAGVGTTVNILENNMSPDVAGCMARSARDENVWSSPAGKTRGRILGVVSLQQNFTESDSNYLYGGGVNPVMTIPGQGTFLLGNKTSSTTSATLSRINTTSMIVYIRKQLLNVAEDLLFEINDTETRQRMINLATPILESVLGGNGISSYRLVCDETNNTEAVIAAGQLVFDVFVNATFAAETLVIRITNTTTSEATVS